MVDNPIEKAKHQTREAALDFVVLLPMWDCIQRLEQTAPNAPAHFQIDYDYHDEVKKATLKQVPYVMVIIVNQQTMTQIKGKIRQKDENSTQFTGTAEFVHEVDKAIQIRQNFASLCLLFIILASVYLVFDQPSVFAPFIFFTSLLIYLVLILVLDSRNTAIKMQQLTEMIQRQLLFE